MIGVFDSGYGGLTVFKPLIEKFPKYDFVYFGDNARAPYGSRGQEEIYQYTKEAVDWLFKEGCELIILACNTASSQALRRIQQESLPGSKFSLRRVLGVLIPVAEVIAASGAKTVGILATEATVKSGAYEREIKKIAPEIKITQVAAPLLIPLIEKGLVNDLQLKKALHKYMQKFIKEVVKNIVLGCTHYPLIKYLIQVEMSASASASLDGPEAKIFDSPSVIPASLENYLSRHPEIEKLLLRSGKRRFVTTGDPEKFSKFARDFLNIEIKAEKVNL